MNNNNCLGQGLRNLTLAYQGYDQANKGECYEFSDTDFAKVAQTFDCFGAVVEKPQDFPQGLRSRNGRRPAGGDRREERPGRAGRPALDAAGLTH